MQSEILQRTKNTFSANIMIVTHTFLQITQIGMSSIANSYLIEAFILGVKVQPS